MRNPQLSLLIRNHPDEQFGIPMETISRLERVRTDQIDSVGGLEVLQYRGSSLPLLALEKHIRATPRLETEQVYIVVFSVRQREIGLIVPHLQDIRPISTNVDTVTFRESGVIGSLEVDSRATRLLDLYELTRLAHPDWFAEVGSRPSDGAAGAAPDQPADSKARILLAEDSGFFRKQVSGFLMEAGFDVVDCEDGQIAWDTLRHRGEEFDIVVTDIEMPNMDGCQFARRIKDDPSLAHLPVIALTSLASEEDMQRGMESGIDDYQVKLDRERLMTSVERYVREMTRPEGFPNGTRTCQEWELTMIAATESVPTVTSSETEYVTFYVGEILLGIDINGVDEINRHVGSNTCASCTVIRLWCAELEGRGRYGRRFADDPWPTSRRNRQEHSHCHRPFQG